MGEVSRTGAWDGEPATCFANWIHNTEAKSPAGSTEIVRLCRLDLQSCLRCSLPARSWTRNIAAGAPAKKRIVFPTLLASRLLKSPSKEGVHEPPHSCRATVA